MAHPDLDRLRPQHPRLFLTPDRVAELHRLRQTDPLLTALLARLASDAATLTGDPLPTYTDDGTEHRRLLYVSRDVLRRVLSWSLQCRLAPDQALLDRLWQELAAVCAFPDWHPPHFLDVAEMALAVAIGYDWCFDHWSPEQRGILREALVRHALEPGLVDGWWVRSDHNWNQVCHGGLAIAALAVAEDEPTLAAAVLDQARDHVDIALAAYAPDGVYPEGPAYWQYGTSYTVLLCAALQSACGHDWDLPKRPGFSASFTFMIQAIGPSGWTCNFADAEPEQPELVEHWWLAQATGQGDHARLAQMQEQRRHRPSGGTPYRFAPLAAVWYCTPPTTIADLPLDYVGRGRAQIGCLRSSWDDPRARFIAIKAGDLDVNHGHLDAGTIIVEADGVRWAVELGREPAIYARLDTWGREQDSPRWAMRRANNHGHSTLTIGNRLQCVGGVNHIGDPVTEASGARLAVDCSPAYADVARHVTREIALVENREVIRVADEIVDCPPDKDLCWRWITTATIALVDHGRSATLTQAGESLTIELHEPAAASFTIEDLAPDSPDECRNDDHRALTIRLPPPLPDPCRIVVVATPGSTAASRLRD